MTPQPPSEPPIIEPDPYAGPYSADNGVDAYGHPVNAAGRCAGLNSVPDNTVPPACPTRLERSGFLLAQPVDDVVMLAYSLGVTIPPLLAGNALRAALVPLILLVEGYPA